MKRRGFLVSSLAASALAGAASRLDGKPPDAEPATAAREYYELRKYQLRRGPQQQRIDDYFRDANIPAMNRQGVKPVGVFNILIGPGNATLYVLAAHASADSAMTIHDRLRADPEYKRAGAPFTNAPSTDPSYVRMESFLFGSLAGWPKLQLPPATAGNKPHIFELRTYESHSKKANLTKIEMFNRGEIAIFLRLGLHPVFFGETLVGSGQPSLTYMLVFADMEERTRQWAAFGADPEWKKLSMTPGLNDGEIVSTITNVILSPTPYSQIS